MYRFYVIAALCLLAMPGWAQDQTVYEAETVAGPETAWGQDINPVDKWNLWSKDTDADKKWSGGKVLQSPPVKADREKPEDGAPVLHIVIPDLEAGDYFVDLKYGRNLGVSLDGATWRPMSELGSRLGRLTTKDGKIEFWVDDRYADARSPGFSYLDTITLTRALPEVNGVANGGFEFSPDLKRSGWVWWSREKKGLAEIVEPGRSGKRAMLLQHEGDQDFALIGSGRQEVKPGQTWIATAWMKCENTDQANLDIVAEGQGRVLFWSIGSDGVMGSRDWTKVTAEGLIPVGCDRIYLRVTGAGKVKVWVDDLSLALGQPTGFTARSARVNGWAKQRVNEKLDRGLVALRAEEGKVYVGWRMLKTDPESIAFNLYRASGRGRPVKLNTAPLTRTTDFVDTQPAFNFDSHYFVRPVLRGREGDPSTIVSLPANPPVQPYLSFKLQGDYRFQKAGIADLDGDGKYDYVLKQPFDNIDPYSFYWTPSPDTYKLEAYRHDGAFLWRYDLGWAIERGIWYSPYVVFDLDGDGKAEVIAKTGEGDPRGSDGRVYSGAEYVTVLDGLTGKEKARAPWLDRKPFGGGASGYNYASRNQLGIAYLDGKTPCLIVARGTYTVMQCAAYQLVGGKLEQLWLWDNRLETTGNWRGQGAHWMHCGDVDGDGRDEVVLGSCVIDDDGKGLWTTGLGHPDRCFLTDVDPSRPGLEIFYHIEPPRKTNGLCLVDAKSGEIIWGLPEQTWHVGIGMAADIDPAYPGMECWAAEDPKGDPKQEKYRGNPPRWLLTAQGELLARDEKTPPSYTTVYWDADSLRELAARGGIMKWGGQMVTQGIEGSQVAWADILGDWREEIICTLPGELRIYTTTLPATDRRPCLMQDPVYRHDVAHLAMGYGQPPCLSYAITQNSPLLWLKAPSATIRQGQTLQIKACVAAPGGQAVRGVVRLTGGEGLTITPPQATLSAGAGQTAQAPFEVTLQNRPGLLSGGKIYPLTLTLDGPEPLTAAASLKAPEEPLTAVPLVQAEAFSGQGGGAVQIRDDKVGAVGKSFSHWDAAGHWLTWKVTVPAAGQYRLIVRYCTPLSVTREVQVNDAAPSKQVFAGTGGFGGQDDDWAHATLRTGDGKHLLLTLPAGEQTLRLTNLDGRGMNVDYLALVAVK